MAGSEGWQIECWDLAQSRVPFEVKEARESHRPFFEELEAAYNYELNWTGGAVIFSPCKAE